MQSHRLAQPILQRLEQPLYASLGLGAVRADRLDLQLQQRTLELRGLVVLGVGLGEDAVAVAVQRQWCAVALHKCVQQLQVAPGGLLLEELRCQHTAGCVVDKGDQTTLDRAPFEPVVVAAIDLHQFAQTLAPGPRAVHALGPALLGMPQPGLHHPAPQGLHAVAQAVLALQILVCQLRTKVGVVPTHQFDEVSLLRGIDAPVAGPTAPTGHQPLLALLAQSPYQPLDLSNRESELLGGMRLPHLTLLRPPENDQTLHFLATH